MNMYNMIIKYLPSEVYLNVPCFVALNKTLFTILQDFSLFDIYGRAVELIIIRTRHLSVNPILTKALLFSYEALICMHLRF